MMITPLLATKTNIPIYRPNLVIRHRLLELLKQISVAKLAIISAPAGFGKTTLVREWIHQHPIPAAWLSLDEGDRDPVRFLAYCIRALQSVMPGLGEAILEDLNAPHPKSTEQYIAVLINEIVAENPDHFVLILDDYHLVDAHPIHELINYILDNQPQTMHLVIITRADPPLPIARLRGRGELVELRQSNLQFSPEEATDFLNRTMGLDLNEEQISALAARTEGWIAGLQMAAISMQGRDDISSFVQSFTGTNRYILDYLVEEVLHRQPEYIQNFLLHTSILDRFTSDLCEAVTGQVDSKAALDHLERANLFIIPLDDERRWYRYHHLFADLLNKQSLQTPSEVINKLQLKASDWFEGEHMPEEAIRYALAAKDYERAARLLGPNIYSIMGRGEMITLDNFFAALPEIFIRNHPILSIQRVWGLTFSGQLAQAETMLIEIEGRLAGSTSKDVFGNIALIKALIANIRGDIDKATTLAQKASELLSTESVEARAMIPFILGNGHLMVGDLEKAEQSYKQIKQTGYAVGNLWTIAHACNMLTHIKRLQGRLREAHDSCEEVLQFAAVQGAENYGSLGTTYFELADLFREQNDLETAMDLATRALDLMKLWAIPTDQVNGLIILARIYLAQEDNEGATRVLRKIHYASRQGNIFQFTQKYLNACQVRLWLMQNNLLDAARWADKFEAEWLPAIPKKQIDFINEVDFLSLARVRIAQGVKEHNTTHLDKAKRLLSDLEMSSRRGHRSGRLIEILVLQAIVYEHLDHGSEALAALETGLSLAIPEGYARVFLDEGEVMRNLLHQAKKQGIFPQDVSNLLIAFDEQDALKSRPKAQESQILLLDPLSEREMEVLHLLPTEMTASEIADHLFVAKSTVDTHIKHIYSKLGVNRRMEAIQRARELTLL